MQDIDMSNLNSRRGRIKITRETMMDIGYIHGIFKWLEFIPLHTNSNFMSDTVEISGISPMFNTVSLGEILPEYKILSNCDDQGVITYGIEEVVNIERGEID